MLDNPTNYLQNPSFGNEHIQGHDSVSNANISNIANTTKNFDKLSKIYLSGDNFDSNTSPISSIVIVDSNASDKNSSNSAEKSKSNYNNKKISNKVAALANENFDMTVRSINLNENSDERPFITKNFCDRFLSNFEGFHINKSFCEKICCRAETNLFRLRKLKIPSCENDEKLIGFICDNLKNIEKNQIQNYSVVDLYMLCSLIENDQILIYIENNEGLLKFISRATEKFINSLVINKLSDQEIPRKFFMHTREFCIDFIKCHGSFFDKQKFDEINLS